MIPEEAALVEILEKMEAVPEELLLSEGDDSWKEGLTTCYGCCAGGDEKLCEPDQHVITCALRVVAACQKLTEGVSEDLRPAAMIKSLRTMESIWALCAYLRLEDLDAQVGLDNDQFLAVYQLMFFSMLSASGMTAELMRRDSGSIVNAELDEVGFEQLLNAPWTPFVI